MAPAADAPQPWLVEKLLNASIEGILSLIGTAVGVVFWAQRRWWKRRQRMARERKWAELRDQSLTCLTAALAHALRLISARPCMLGTPCVDQDSSADVEAQRQVAVLIDRLDSLHASMTELVEEGK